MKNNLNTRPYYSSNVVHARVIVALYPTLHSKALLKIDTGGIQAQV